MKIGILQVGERVTEERVHEAVAYIVSEGQKPTFDNVKAYLGKGSKTTILPFIKSYTHATGNAFEAMSETLPPDMLEDALTQAEKDKALAFIEELFSGRDTAIKKEARQEVDDLKGELAEERQALLEVRGALTNEAEKTATLEEALKTLTAEKALLLEQEESRKSEENHALIELKALNAAQNEELTTLRTKSEENAKQVSSLLTEKALLLEGKATLEAQKDDIKKKLESERADMQRKLDALSAELKESLKAHAEAEKRAVKAEALHEGFTKAQALKPIQTQKAGQAVPAKRGRPPKKDDASAANANMQA